MPDIFPGQRGRCGNRREVVVIRTIDLDLGGAAVCRVREGQLSYTFVSLSELRELCTLEDGDG